MLKTNLTLLLKFGEISNQSQWVFSGKGINKITGREKKKRRGEIKKRENPPTLVCSHNKGSKNAPLIDAKLQLLFILLLLHTALYNTHHEKYKQTTDTLVKRPSILLWRFTIMEFNCGKSWIILAECHLVHSNWESGTFLTKVFKLLLKSGSCCAQIRGEVWGFSIRNFKVFSICFFTLTGNYPERHIIVQKWQKLTKVFLRYVNCQW